MMWMAAMLGATCLAMIAQSACTPEAPTGDAPAWYDYRIVHIHPHDPEAFTQGLLFRDGDLFESTGLYGESTLRRVRLETGEVLQRHALARRYFGEGLVDWGDRLIQLTWQENTALVYDLATFELVETFAYRGQGWGITHDGRRLIMSDGTAELRFLDPDTFTEIGRLRVTEHGQPVPNLNELEMVRGDLLANVWGSDEIVIIDLDTGHVTGRIDLRGILSAVDHDRNTVDVLNGIAWDEEGERLFVTGKLWPALFEIELVRRP
jgi:glutaminyl-peptide cyclotransferase